MHKKILVLLTGAIALSISAVPVLASDPPTDDGQYIWQQIGYLLPFIYQRSQIL